jgi:type II secretory pathway component PulK
MDRLFYITTNVVIVVVVAVAVVVVVVMIMMMMTTTIKCVLNYTLTFARKWLKLHTEHWYKHVPISEETSHQNKATILRNQQVQIDRSIPYNKWDIIVRDNEKETAC